MSTDIFLKLDGIPGESRDDKHRGEIEIESFSWGESNLGAHATASGAGAGRVSMQDFHFVAKVSKASPTLMLNCASGKHIKEGTITVRKAGDNAQSGFEFLFYKLTDVLVTSFQQGGATSDLPVEQVSLAFAKIQVEYKEQKADGSLGAVVNFGWNLKVNKLA